jgi:hypothetical protein
MLLIYGDGDAFGEPQPEEPLAFFNVDLLFCRGPHDSSRNIDVISVRHRPTLLGCRRLSMSFDFDNMIGRGRGVVLPIDRRDEVLVHQNCHIVEVA